MPHQFTTTRRVEFAETDMAGIAHFANFFRWMESAEHEFFRSLGVSVHGRHAGCEYGFARVHASCDYARPTSYEDVLEIELAVRKKTAKALGYEFVFRIQESSAAESSPGEIARGRVEVVCVKRSDDGRLRAADLPEEIARQVDVAP